VSNLRVRIRAAVVSHNPRDFTMAPLLSAIRTKKNKTYAMAGCPVEPYLARYFFWSCASLFARALDFAIVPHLGENGTTSATAAAAGAAAGRGRETAGEVGEGAIVAATGSGGEGIVGGGGGGGGRH